MFLLMDEIEEASCENAVFACTQHNIKAEKAYVYKMSTGLGYQTWNP